MKFKIAEGLSKIAVRNGISAVVSRSGRKFRRKGHTNPLFLTYLLFFESPKISCWVG